jgi:hypothetical protein
MQDRSWNLARRSFEPPIQPVQQKKETQEIGKQIDRYTIINKIETPAQASIDTAITSSKTSGFITPFNKVLASGFNI